MAECDRPDICPACGNNRIAWYHDKAERLEGFGGRGDCPSCVFAFFGDMYTLRELRAVGSLDDPAQEAQRVSYIAEAEKAGRDPDVDPTLCMFTIKVDAEEVDHG
jgi:hypothetical protein